MEIPLTITTDKDKLKFLYRAVELLRLEHNVKGKEFRDGIISRWDFDDYIRTSFEPRNQRLFAEINQLKEKLDLVRNYNTEGGFSPNLIEARKIKGEGKEMKEFDKDIDLTKI